MFVVANMISVPAGASFVVVFVHDVCPAGIVQAKMTVPNGALKTPTRASPASAVSEIVKSSVGG